LQLGLDACRLEIAQKATDIARYCWSKSAEVMRRHAQGEDLGTAHMTSVLARHGSSIRAIARSTGLSRNTVRRYLRGGEEAAVRKAPAKRAEKLDPFKAYIRERVAAAAPDRIPAVVLFRELRARGLGPIPGSLGTVHDQCRPGVFSLSLVQARMTRPRSADCARRFHIATNGSPPPAADGLCYTRSRDGLGGFRVVDSISGNVIAGENFERSLEDLVGLLKQGEAEGSGL
jgi:AcrR family transcriptional regulator